MDETSMIEGMNRALYPYAMQLRDLATIQDRLTVVLAGDDVDELRAAAQAWLDATTEAELSKLVEAGRQQWTSQLALMGYR